MAKITYTPGWDHVHGHVGQFIYRESQGRDILAKKPDRVTQANSPAQMAQRENFRQAAGYAKGAMANAPVHAAYKARARALRSSPFAVAVKDYLTPPVVDQVDVSSYHRQPGDVILITAHDDFEVAGVMVFIEDNVQATVESGPATWDATAGAWRYVATTDASAKPSVLVTVTASDRPGHTGMLTATA